LSTEIAILKPTVTATLRPSPTPNVFTVQPGDTLFGIAQEVDVPINALMAANGLTNPDQLSVGQILLIPSEEWIAAFQERQPTVRARASITPSPVVEPHAVEIRGVEAPGDLDREAITIENRGGVVDMRDWRMSDGEGNTYTFPAFTLHRGAFNLNIKEGNDTPIDLYWNLEESILTPGKTLTLSDADGKVVSTFTIPE
jgi:LysM repeat protein